MSKFTVTPSELDELTSQMESFTREAQQQVDDLDRTIRDMHVTWTGSAASAQQAAYEKQHTGLREMNEGLATIKTAIGVASKQYRAAVAKNQSLMNELR